MPNKPCILLDLDETIIHSLSPGEVKRLNKHQKTELPGTQIESEWYITEK